MYTRHSFLNQGCELVYYTLGDANKPALLFLSGGPGDDHHYLRSVSEHYADDFYCILLDQRGCGESTVNSYNASNLNIHLFLDDIDTLRQHLEREKLHLFGHSWGAMLGLYYAVTHPHQSASLLLIGMGPLDEEAKTVASANLLKPLTQAEREDYSHLKAQRRQAYQSADWEVHARIHQEMVTRYNVRAWFYDPLIAQDFAQDFRAHYNYNPRIAPYLLPTLADIDLSKHYATANFPILCVYGYQDFEPITQAYILQNHLPDCQPLFIHEAGHVPWYEQPDLFYAQTLTFLQNHSH